MWRMKLILIAISDSTLCVFSILLQQMGRSLDARADAQAVQAAKVLPSLPQCRHEAMQCLQQTETQRLKELGFIDGITVGT